MFKPIRVHVVNMIFTMLIALCFCSCDDGGSTNTSLMDLRISISNLEPAFDPSIREYDVTVPVGITSVDITAVTKESSQVLKVDDKTVTSRVPFSAELDFSPGAINWVVIQVYAEDDETMGSYSIMFREEKQ